MPSYRSSSSYNQSAERERLRLSTRRTFQRILVLLRELDKINPKISEQLRRHRLNNLHINISQLQTETPPRYRAARQLVCEQHKIVHDVYVWALAAAERKRRAGVTETGNSMDASPSGGVDDGEAVGIGSMEVDNNDEELSGLFGSLEVQEQGNNVVPSGVGSESMDLE